MERCPRCGEPNVWPEGMEECDLERMDVCPDCDDELLEEAIADMFAERDEVDRMHSYHDGE